LEAVGAAYEKSFEDLVEKYSDLVYRLSVLYMRNRQDAEDCCQNVFLKAYRTNPVFNDEAHARAWFIIVTRNECRNMLNSYWRKNTVNIEDVTLTVKDEYQRGIVREVLSLPEKYRDIIYLHYYEGYKIAELTEMLGLKANTIKSRLLRGRELLRAKLEERGYGYEKD